MNMFSRLSIVAILAMLLQSCAAQQSEIDIDHNAPSEKSATTDDERGFDPCKLNSNLPVCKNSSE